MRLGRKQIVIIIILIFSSGCVLEGSSKSPVEPAIDCTWHPSSVEVIFNELWMRQVSGFVRSSPTICDTDGTGDFDIYVGSYDGRMYAIDGILGITDWSFTTGGQITSSPSFYDLNEDGNKEIIFGSWDGHLYTLNGSDGSLFWDVDLDGGIHSAPAISDVNGDETPDVVVGTYNNEVHALNGQNGSTIWIFDTGGQMRGSPAIGDLNNDTQPEVIVGGANLFALDGETGDMLWTYESDQWIYSSPVIGDFSSDGLVNVICASRNSIFMLNGIDGSEAWFIDYPVLGYFDYDPVIADLTGDGFFELVICSDVGDLFVISCTDGGILWQYAFDASVDSSPIIADFTNDTRLNVFIGTSNKNYAVFDGANGTIIDTMQFTGFSRATPVIGDLDDDGLFDIIIVDDSSRITRYECISSGVRLYWPGLGATPTHTRSITDIDSDGDSLSYYTELFIGTNPNSIDSDNDTMSDFWEVSFGTNPLFNDAYHDYDLDGLTNIEEYILGTNPYSADSDSDGYNDLFEVNSGFDPLDPNMSAYQIIVIYSGTIVVFIGLSTIGLIIIRAWPGIKERQLGRERRNVSGLTSGDRCSIAKHYLENLEQKERDGNNLMERGLFKEALLIFRETLDLLWRHKNALADCTGEKFGSLRDSVHVAKYSAQLELLIIDANQQMEEIRGVAQSSDSSFDTKVTERELKNHEKNAERILSEIRELSLNDDFSKYTAISATLASRLLGEIRAARDRIEQLRWTGRVMAIPSTKTEITVEDGDVVALRGCELVGAKFDYKIKVVNKSDYVITNVTTSIVAFPDDCLQILTQQTKTIPRIESGGFRSPMFTFIPTKDCVEGKIMASVSYVDFKDQLHSLNVEPYTIRSVCDLLRPLDAPIDEFELLLEGLTSNSSESELQWNAQVLFQKAQTILPSKNFHIIDCDERTVGEQYIGLIRGLAEGKYTKKKVATVIVITGMVDASSSQVTIQALGEDNAMLPTTMQEISESIDSWICLRCGGPISPELVTELKQNVGVQCRYCSHTLTIDLYKR